MVVREARYLFDLNAAVSARDVSNPLNNGVDAYVAGGAEVLKKPQLVEDLVGISGERLIGRGAAIEAYQDGDDTANDRGVTFGTIVDDAVVEIADDPHITHAAVDLGAMGLVTVGQLAQTLAEVHEVLVASVPVAQHLKVVGQFIKGDINGHRAYSTTASRPYHIGVMCVMPKGLARIHAC
jgi:hypothetical protein